jgi:hypothetical protein
MIGGGVGEGVGDEVGVGAGVGTGGDVCVLADGSGAGETEADASGMGDGENGAPGLAVACGMGRPAACSVIAGTLPTNTARASSLRNYVE